MFRLILGGGSICIIQDLIRKGSIMDLNNVLTNKQIHCKCLRQYTVTTCNAIPQEIENYDNRQTWKFNHIFNPIKVKEAMVIFKLYN